ncbi:SMI1/KNR4 family protein [Streptacidiphilus jiangxiensis]|uniref:SMI1/KNR4 family protein n=1 Tax=Streptacidiphilus jiangxiensis TaxID=235985 RepID=UPI000945A8B2|nr:SMI1/KNR4 family protein [Streptacidiphilus jiangxiensis]
MHPGIERLRLILPPPVGGGDDIDWEAEEERLALVFPSDYKEFVRIYGGGSVAGYLAIATPSVSESPYSEISDWQPIELGAQEHRGLRDVSLGIRDRLILVGVTASSDAIFWHANEGEANSWNIVVCTRDVERGENPWKYYRMGFSGFVASLIDGSVENPFGMDDFPGRNPTYMSWRGN